jgi:VanZ family protein
LGLISVGLGIAIVTLLPVHAGLSQGIRPGMLSALGATFLGNLRVIDPLDLLQNVLLFLPFGYFIAAPVFQGSEASRTPAEAERKSGGSGALRACVAGVLLSLGLEFLQLWIPGRYCSMLDVVLNGMGAFLGGALAFAWRPEAGKPLGEV